MSKRETWKEGWGDDVAHHNLRILKDDRDSVIRGKVRKTVGPGKDFNTFHQAMQWYMSVDISTTGQVQLVLDDGVHYIGPVSDFDTDGWTYYHIKGSLTIISASGQKGACTLTMPPEDDGENWPIIFYNIGGALTMWGVIFDLTAGGYPYPKTASAFYNGGALFTFRNSTVKNAWAGVEAYQGSYVSLFSLGSGNLIDECDYGISTIGSIIDLVSHTNDTTISNCDVAMDVANGAKIMMKTFSGGALVLTDNTTDYSAPLNEIQYDQSCISSGTAALTLKA